MVDLRDDTALGDLLLLMNISKKVQQSPDNHTMLNHTTLLFAPNFSGIKWNVNKFALIMAQKSPDNHTIIFQFSTFDTFIHQLLPA